MKTRLLPALLGLLVGASAVYAFQPATRPAGRQLALGNFSVSLAVKDLAASRAFYEKLDFKPVFGNGKRFIIMQNGQATLGLFQGEFKNNILTFNPGWDARANTLESFDDVRDIQASLKSRGLKLDAEADPNSTGPASLTLYDPDGNQVLLDQHVPRPTR